MMETTVRKSSLVGITAMVFISGILLFAGCGTSNGPESTDTNSVAYSQTTRNAFIKSCELASRGQTAGCLCVLDTIEERISEEEFAELERQIVQGGLDAAPEWFIQARKNCIEG